MKLLFLRHKEKLVKLCSAYDNFHFLIFYNLVEYYEKDDFYGEEIDPDFIIYKDDPNSGTTEENDESLEVVSDNFVSFWHSGSLMHNSMAKMLSFYKYFNQ